MSNQLDKILVSSTQPDFVDRLAEIRAAVFKATHIDSGTEEDGQLEHILDEVTRRGDKALAEFTEKFDGVKLSPQEFRITVECLERSHRQVDPAILGSIRLAIENVRKYQAEIFIGNKETHPGIRYTPIQSVGLCVPGASAPLPSTVIMTAVPAQVAGVERIVVVSPPRHKGTIHPVTLAACYELGIDEVYRIGGAHAVMALAKGTETIKPNVDKVVGPGNRWVQMAKKKVFGLVGIDSIAGPSEVLIIASGQANPVWVAADMLSQAEHGPGSAVVFTDSQRFADTLLGELKKQVVELGRSEQTMKCLEDFGGIVVFSDMQDAVCHANVFAVEHLQIQCGTQSREIAARIRNAGAIFIGPYSPVAVGDYWAGPSHTLPTGTSARFSSALTSNDFVKSISIIQYSNEQLQASADDIIRLAEVEGLDAHAKSVKIRLDT